MPGLPAGLLAAALAQALGLAMKSIRGGRQVTVVAVLVELFLQGLHLLLQQHHLVLHLSDQRVSLRKLLLQQALFLSQVNHFFFGCHIPTVFGSGLVGKPLVLVNSYCFSPVNLYDHDIPHLFSSVAHSARYNSTHRRLVNLFHKIPLKMSAM